MLDKTVVLIDFPKPFIASLALEFQIVCVCVCVFNLVRFSTCFSIELCSVYVAYDLNIIECNNVANMLDSGSYSHTS